MHRPTVGVIALTLILGWVWLTFWPLNTDWSEPLRAACSRVGWTMGALWLALPQLVRLPGWLLKAIAIIAVICAYKPRIALFAVPLLIAYLALVHIPLSRKR
jgi:hypothetical protein